MPRLHRESSRPYPGRSARERHGGAARKPTGEDAGSGHRLTKSRRHRERIRPVSRHETKGANRKALRSAMTWPFAGVRPGSPESPPHRFVGPLLALR
jgi:hypothetical protein